MTKIDLLHLIEKCAIDYKAEGARESLIRNSHMNGLGGEVSIEDKVIDAILVDFINFIGGWQGVNYGLRTYHLNEEQ